MSIARNSAGTTITATGLSTSITRSHTTSGSDRLLLVSTQTANITTDNITAAAYNSISFFSTRIGLAQFTNGGNGNTYLYYQVAPSTGTNNCTITCSTANVFRVYTASYTGVDQTNPIDVSTTNNTNTVSGVDVSMTVTVTASNCWAHMVATNNAATPIAGAGATRLTTGTNGPGYAVFDSNGTIATGSYTMGWYINAVTGQGTVLAVIKPVAAASTFIPRVTWFM